jgi:hypothetical protein
MRLVVAGLVSKRELMEDWSLEDVWDAHVVLDAKEEAAVRAAKPKSKKGGR